MGRERQNPCDTSGMTRSTAPAPYKGHRFPLEIVCPHMTKTHILTRRRCGNRVPDLHVVVRHNHAVHEAFNELTLLLERRVLQPCPDERTKGSIVVTSVFTPIWRSTLSPNCRSCSRRLSRCCSRSSGRRLYSSSESTPPRYASVSRSTCCSKLADAFCRFRRRACSSGATKLHSAHAAAPRQSPLDAAAHDTGPDQDDDASPA